MKELLNMYQLGFLILMFGFCFQSCSSNLNPKPVYMPDMYYSEAYEPYSDTIRPYRKDKNTVSLFKDGITSLLPVTGTVPRTDDGSLPYLLPNSNQGYETSKKILTSPFLNTKVDILERGKSIYQINCAICHGDIGNGQGELVKNEKILGVPNYKNLPITIGSIYHVIMYGKNNMGSYSSQLISSDRWKVSEYVMHLKKNNSIIVVN